jgi:hypothetical protein
MLGCCLTDATHTVTKKLSVSLCVFAPLQTHYFTGDTMGDFLGCGDVTEKKVVLHIKTEGFEVCCNAEDAAEKSG